MKSVLKCAMGSTALLGVALLLMSAGGNELRFRRAVAAGAFYPSDPAQLRAAVEQYLNEVTVLETPGPVVGCIVPHSPYSVAGSVMAKAVKQIPQNTYRRVIVLAPAMQNEFRGCSVPSVQYFRTPLGDVELDAPAIRRICVNSLIQIRALVYRQEAYSGSVGRSTLHETETAIEVILPFLQVHLGEFKLVPILVSKLDKVTGKFDEHALDTVVNTINAIVDEHTLVIVCSDFTRYGSKHNFTPFTRNVLENISELDMQAFNLIQERQVRGFQAYLEQTKSTITAPVALSTFMRLMPASSKGILVGYDLSGRMTGNPRTSVSFASMVFIDGMQERTNTRRKVIRITDKQGEEIQPEAPAADAPGE